MYPVLGSKLSQAILSFSAGDNKTLAKISQELAVKIKPIDHAFANRTGFRSSNVSYRVREQVSNVKFLEDFLREFYENFYLIRDELFLVSGTLLGVVRSTIPAVTHVDFPQDCKRLTLNGISATTT